MRPLSILVADDETIILDLVRAWLERDGHTVTTAQSGRRAAEALRAKTFDLAILDVRMPAGNGLDLMHDLRANGNDVRILAISGGGPVLSGGDCLKLAQSMGAHGFLLKPFTHDELLTGIRNALPHPAPA